MIICYTRIASYGMDIPPALILPEEAGRRSANSLGAKPAMIPQKIPQKLLPEAFIALTPLKANGASAAALPVG
jgi:hypothetical protein